MTILVPLGIPTLLRLHRASEGKAGVEKLDFGGFQANLAWPGSRLTMNL